MKSISGICTGVGTVVLLQFGSVAAQEPCVALARVIVINQTSSFSYDEQKSVNKADFCSEKYSQNNKARAAQIEGAYMDISGGASGSESEIRTEQEKQCQGRYGEFWRAAIRSNEARTVSSDALNVIKACLVLNGQGIKPHSTIGDDGREFNFSFEWSSTPAQALKVNYVGPVSLANYDCSADSGLSEPRSFKPIKTPGDVRTTVPSGGSFTLVCRRPTRDVVRDGETNTCYPETILTVSTNGPPAAIKIPSVCHPSMPSKRAQAIEDRLGSAETRVSALEQSGNSLSVSIADLGRRTNMLDAGAHFVLAGGACPAGWAPFAYLLVAIGTEGGAFSARSTRVSRSSKLVINATISFAPLTQSSAC